MKVISEKELITNLEIHSRWLNNQKQGKQFKIYNKIIATDIDIVFLEENQITLEKTFFSNCYFHGIMLNQVSIEKSFFDNCSFTNAIFHRTDLKGSHFEKIQGEKISILGCNIQDFVFQDITLTTVRLEALTSIQTQNASFINCKFNDESSIIDCTFEKTKLSNVYFSPNMRIKNTNFHDCIFDTKETEKILKDFGAIITFSSYKLMSWEIIIVEESYTSYIYTFFLGIKESLTQKYNSLVIELEHTKTPSIVLNISVIDSTLITQLTYEIQKSIYTFIESLTDQKHMANIENLEEYHNKLYQFIGFHKTLKQLHSGLLDSNITDTNGSNLKLLDTILKMPQINVIIGDNNIIGNYNNLNTIEYSLLSKK